MAKSSYQFKKRQKELAKKKKKAEKQQRKMENKAAETDTTENAPDPLTADEKTGPHSESANRAETTE